VRLYQNTHRSEDLSPIWVINTTNRSFVCEPGTCGLYSSTNYVLLGLVLAQHGQVDDWDQLDQTMWRKGHNIPGISDMKYAVHGPIGNFTTATGDGGTAVSGYQTVCRSHRQEHGGRCLPVSMADDADVENMSSTQGWTCGNLMAPVSDVAAFYWGLLGPTQNKERLLSEASLNEMLTFRTENYFGRNRSATGPGSFGYGLGMMNFTSMDWGFNDSGLFYGHNGLTYGFGSQSGYNYDHEFSVTWVNNAELWIGPDFAKSAGGVVPANRLYAQLVEAVEKHR